MYHQVDLEIFSLGGPLNLSLELSKRPEDLCKEILEFLLVFPRQYLYQLLQELEADS